MDRLRTIGRGDSEIITRTSSAGATLERDLRLLRKRHRLSDATHRPFAVRISDASTAFNIWSCLRRALILVSEELRGGSEFALAQLLAVPFQGPRTEQRRRGGR